MDNITVDSFGKMPSGEDVKLITISYGKSAKISLTNYGAKLVSLFIPDKNSTPIDIVLGYNSLYDYINGNRFFGANVGPFANRIANAHFKIDDKECFFEPNEGQNLLHSGNRAIESVLWSYKIYQNRVVFKYKSIDGEFGFPGNKIFSIAYTWLYNLSLSIEYEVCTDKDTHINLTHHSYFNLDGEGSESILDHFVQINSSEILEVDKNNIPTGNFICIKNRALDLSFGKKIKDCIFANDKILQDTQGFDQCYVVNKTNDMLPNCARVWSVKSGCSLDVYSDMPGLQFYTDNHNNGNIAGKSGSIYPMRSALCLEPQFFPNTPNIPAFPTTLIRKKEKFNRRIVFKFNQK